MKIILLCLSIQLIAACALPLQACECVSLSFAEEVSRADYIFIGTVLDGYSHSEDYVHKDMHYRFSIQKVFKGTRTDTVATGFGGGDCGMGFKLGETYLVYTTNGATTACRRNELLAKSSDVGRLLYLFEPGFAATVGKSNAPLLTENEAIYLGYEFNRESSNFIFSGKKMGYIESDCAITKQTFFQKFAGGNISTGLIILSEQEKHRFGGFDAIVVAYRKRFRAEYSRGFRKRAARRVRRLAD